MKQAETVFKAKKRYLAIMLLCFLYGGFSIFFFLYNTYSIFWMSEIAAPEGFGQQINDANRFVRAAGDENRFFRPERDGLARLASDPMAMLSSPQTITYLIGGIIALLAGIAIWQLVREKEIKTAKQEIAKNLLLPDEKAVIEVLRKFDFELTQAKIAKETGLSKVQVHRAIRRLESRGMVEKHEYGLTNKIILKKEFFE